jgi:hypothetical protein
VASERRLASFQSFEQRWSPFELSAEPTLSLVSFLELAGPSRLLGASETSSVLPNTRLGSRSLVFPAPFLTFTRHRAGLQGLPEPTASCQSGEIA